MMSLNVVALFEAHGGQAYCPLLERWFGPQSRCGSGVA